MTVGHVIDWDDIEICDGCNGQFDASCLTENEGLALCDDCLKDHRIESEEELQND